MVPQAEVMVYRGVYFVDTKEPGANLLLASEQFVPGHQTHFLGTKI